MINNFEKSTKYAQDLFCVKDDKKSEIEREGLENNVPIITREVLNYMIFEAKRVGAKNILEVGTATGFSGIFLAEIANKNGGKLTSVEIDEERYNTAKENFAKMKLGEKNELILGDALEILPELRKAGRKYDFIFIDASKGQYKHFFTESFEMLNEKGIIFIDNIMFRGYVAESPENTPRRYKTIVRKLDEFIKELSDNYNFVLLPFGDGVGLVRK